MFKAAFHGQLEYVQLLVNAGADRTTATPVRRDFASDREGAARAQRARRERGASTPRRDIANYAARAFVVTSAPRHACSRIWTARAQAGIKPIDMVCEYSFADQSQKEEIKRLLEDDEEEEDEDEEEEDDGERAFGS